MPARCTAAPCGPPLDTTTAPPALALDAVVGKACSTQCGRRVATHGRYKLCACCREDVQRRVARHTLRAAKRGSP